MTASESPATRRKRLLADLFPEGVPGLWCPPLTHYDAEGAIDLQRVAAQLEFMSPWVKGLLVPGSTGDGWELSASEARELVELVLGEVQRLKLRLLIGALRPVAADARRVIAETRGFLQDRAEAEAVEECLVQTRVCGFAVCPPRGRLVTQLEMDAALSDVLSLGLPTAMYQIPQVTENVMRPELVASLARRFGNFILFKDSSGADDVAKTGHDFDGLFLVRGAEGNYAQWLKTGGGVYHGLLLSTANCFGRQLHQISENLSTGRLTEAKEMSERLTGFIKEMSRLVRGIPDGNQFANAGKAVDHFHAHGPSASQVPPPRLHSGRSLPVEVIRATGEALARHRLMPAKGYLE